MKGLHRGEGLPEKGTPTGIRGKGAWGGGRLGSFSHVVGGQAWLRRAERTRWEA